MIRLFPRASASLLLVAALVACPEGDDDDSAGLDDDNDTPATIAASGFVYDEDTGAPVPDCEVGVTRSQAIRTGNDGRFTLEVEAGEVLNVRCEGAIPRSFALPEGLGELNWDINVDFWGAPAALDECLLNVVADLSGLGLTQGDGSAEIRVLGADGSTSTFTTPARDEITFLGFLTAPAGPFRVVVRAFGGSIAGYGISAVTECAGGGATVDVADIVLGFADLREVTGTWAEAGAEPTLELYGPRTDTNAALDGAELRIDHRLTSRDDGFTVTAIDGVVAPSLRARACRVGNAGRACLHRRDIPPDESIAFGELPEFMIVGARLGAGRLEMFTDRPVEDGAVSALLLDVTDPFDPVPIWRGWSTTGELSVSTEWIGTVPPAELLSFIPSGVERVVYDFPEAYSPAEQPDGWVELRPATTDVANGD